MREYAMLIDKGASYKIRVGTVDAENNNAIDLSTWSCVFTIIDRKNKVVISKNITPSIGYFDVFLTSTETDLLNEREYRYNIDISKGEDKPRILKGDIKVYQK